MFQVLFKMFRKVYELGKKMAEVILIIILWFLIVRAMFF